MIECRYGLRKGNDLKPDLFVIVLKISAEDVLNKFRTDGTEIPTM